MLQFSRWQVGLIAFLVALGAYFALPNLFPEGEAPPGFVEESRVTLGLDLQGGSYLLLQVDTEGVLRTRVSDLRADLIRELRDRGGEGGAVRYSQVAVRPDNVSVRIGDEGRLEEAERRLRRMGQGLGGLGGPRELDVTRGADQTLVVALTDQARRYYADTAVADSIEAIRRRIDTTGTTEPQITRQGDDRIVVQVPGDGDPERLKNIITAGGQLSFHLVDVTSDANAPLPPRRILQSGRETGPLVLEETPILTGANVTDARSGPSSDSPGFEINFQFDRQGARRFGEVTRENIGIPFAIVLDEEIISAPTIRGAITGGRGRITGDFTPQEASELATLIRAGALPADLTIIDQRSVSATLGADSVRAGTIALVVGFVAVVVFILLTYGRFGLYADLALLANVLLIAGALSLLGATLTLPGIAGIVLTIGMAVDANVLIFERIREELKAGKKPVRAVEEGYKHAWSAIADANITTLIAALIMFILGSGPVRGFAVTLGIGVVTSVFTAFVLTRVFAGGYVLSRRPARLAI